MQHLFVCYVDNVTHEALTVDDYGNAVSSDWDKVNILHNDMMECAAVLADTYGHAPIPELI